MGYRRLNSITKKDSYPLPRINDSLKVLGGSKYFSTMALASGYWQADLSPEDREKCALISSEGSLSPLVWRRASATPLLLSRELWIIFSETLKYCVY